MNRLTIAKDNGEFNLKNYDIKKVPGELYGAICKLKKYEDTGLEPEQISQMDEAYLEKCEEINKLKIKETAVAAVITGHNNAINTDVGDCPTCGRGPIRACDCTYCPQCGQKLRWN